MIEQIQTLLAEPLFTFLDSNWSILLVVAALVGLWYFEQFDAIARKDATRKRL